MIMIWIYEPSTLKTAPPSWVLRFSGSALYRQIQGDHGTTHSWWEVCLCLICTSLRPQDANTSLSRYNNITNEYAIKCQACIISPTSVLGVVSRVFYSRCSLLAFDNRFSQSFAMVGTLELRCLLITDATEKPHRWRKKLAMRVPICWLHGEAFL